MGFSRGAAESFLKKSMLTELSVIATSPSKGLKRAAASFIELMAMPATGTMLTLATPMFFNIFKSGAPDSAKMFIGQEIQKQIAEWHPVAQSDRKETVRTRRHLGLSSF